MLATLSEVRSELGLALELRVGLASGPVVGGVVGQRGFRSTSGATR